MIIVADNFLLILPGTLTQWSETSTLPLPILPWVTSVVGHQRRWGYAYGCVQYTGIGVDALTGTAVSLLPLILATDILHILSFDCSREPDFFYEFIVVGDTPYGQRTTCWALFSLGWVPRCQTLMRDGRKHLYPLSPLAGPNSMERRAF